MGGTDDKSRFAWIEPIPLDPRGIAHIFHLTHNLNPELARDLDRARRSVLWLDIDRDLILAHARDLELSRDLDSALSRAHTLARTHIRGFNRASALDLARSRALDLATHRDREYAHYVNLALDLYIDIITLQERIGDRSPAFEGIRIVREGKK